MSKKKIHPTCRLCDKMNSEMTHCSIYGAMSPENVNNTSIAASCVKSNDYVRLIHAVPNEYNYGTLAQSSEEDDHEALFIINKNGHDVQTLEKWANQCGDDELLIFDSEDEREGFRMQHGMTLEEFVKKHFDDETSND